VKGNLYSNYKICSNLSIKSQLYPVRTRTVSVKWACGWLQSIKLWPLNYLYIAKCLGWHR